MAGGDGGIGVNVVVYVPYRSPRRLRVLASCVTPVPVPRSLRYSLGPPYPFLNLASTVRALYQSSHSDENDVQTVSHTCLVASAEEYEAAGAARRGADHEDLYYLAGTYEPTTGMIYNTEGVPVIC
ncbi:unnamed protein product [Boreogadus saida]